MAKNILILLISPVALSGLFLVSLAAQTKRSSPAQFRATEFAIKDSAGPTGRKLYVTVAGQQRKIYDEAFEAWIINDGRAVVFSSHDGAGGFENEGQSLRIYDVQTRRTRKILSEYFGINAVQAVRTSSAAIALLVKMQDGGLGGSYFSVVDPIRGEVFYRQWAEAIAISGDNFTLAFYREEDFETILQERSPQPENSNRVLEPMILAEAIEKTARQFSTVKKVEICAVGETMIDSELEKPFPKCPGLKPARSDTQRFLLLGWGGQRRFP